MTANDHKSKMAPKHEAPPGLETDGEGQIIPFPERTEDDKEATITGLAKAMHADSVKDPDHDAENPSSMPATLQGHPTTIPSNDKAGQQGGQDGGGRSDK